MRNKRCEGFWVFLIVMAWLVFPTLVLAKEVVQQWELVNPAGVIKVTPIKMAPRITSLEGKTIGLKWNMKPGRKHLPRPDCGIAEREGSQRKDHQVL